VRVGCVKYLNTLPLVAGLERWEEGELVQAVPSKLIGMLLRGEVDVALASVIDAAAEGEGVEALGSGMIGSDGPTYTVRLFSEMPAGEIGDLWVDTDSHTSAVLAQVILAERFGARPRVHDFDARERVGRGSTSEDGWPGAVVLIGDKVATDPPPAGRYGHEVDLGAAWKEMTGLPFVYAVWTCRRGEAETRRVRTAASVLDRQRRHNATRLDWIVSKSASVRGWEDGAARTYIGERLRYDVDEAARVAVDLFIEKASALGACPAERVRWAPI